MQSSTRLAISDERRVKVGEHQSKDAFATDDDFALKYYRNISQYI